MTPLAYILATALLCLSCDAFDSHEGELNRPCKPDGSCVGTLVCRESAEFLGLPWEEPMCHLPPAQRPN